MEIADQDGNGTIDKDEFKDFVHELDKKKTICHADIDEIFVKNDSINIQALDTEEFGLAIWDILKLLKTDLADKKSEEEVEN